MLLKHLKFPHRTGCGRIASLCFVLKPCFDVELTLAGVLPADMVNWDETYRNIPGNPIPN